MSDQFERVLVHYENKIKQLEKENERLRDCVENLIEATVFGVNQWQEAWSPNEETNAQKVIKQALQILKELEK